MPVFLSVISGDALFHLYRFFPLLSVLVLITAAVCLYLRKKSFLIVVVLLGVLYALARFPSAGSPVYNRVLSLTGTISTSAGITSSGKTFQTLRIKSAVDPETGREVEGMRGREASIFRNIGAGPGKRYQLLFITGRDTAKLNPGGRRSNRIYGTVLAAREDGSSGRSSVLEKLNRRRDELNSYIANRFGGDAGALISAVTTGEKAGLSDEGREAFAVTGLSHLLSISGTHFGLFSVVLFGIFLFIARRLPYGLLQRLTMYLTPSQAAAILCIPFMLLYLGISGGRVPAVRSFIMISLFLMGLLMGRKRAWLNSLLFAAFILVIWDPSVIMSLSFQFSFIAVLFIGFSQEKKEEDEGEYGHDFGDSRIIRFLRTSAKLTLAAFLGTAPLAAFHFHLLSAIAPLSNLLVAPLVGFIVVPLSLISAFSFLATGTYILAPVVGKTAGLSVALVKELAKIPFAGLAIPSFPPVLCLFYYAGFFLYLIMGRKKGFLVLPFIPFLVYMLAGGLAQKELSVTFLDVGQGDSAVVELPDDKTIVVDTGKTGRQTAEFLKYRGRKTIDALVLTHNHPDHTGGAEYLMSRFKVKEIWDNGHIGYPSDVKVLHLALERGDEVETDRYSIVVLHPYRKFSPSDGSEYDMENNSSLVLKISGKRRSFLFAGDIEKEAERNLTHLKAWLRSDVIKVPHHGSATSAGDEFLSLASPSIAVISVGKDNPFGHPSTRVLAKLEGSRILRTDRDGAVKMTETDKGLSVKTCREFIFRKPQDLKGELRNLELLFSSW